MEIVQLICWGGRAWEGEGTGPLPCPPATTYPLELTGLWPHSSPGRRACGCCGPSPAAVVLAAAPLAKFWNQSLDQSCCHCCYQDRLRPEQLCFAAGWRESTALPELEGSDSVKGGRQGGKWGDWGVGSGGGRGGREQASALVPTPALSQTCNSCLPLLMSCT